VSEFDARGNESDEFVGMRLSSHSQISAYDRLGSEEIQSAQLAEALQYRPKLMLGLGIQ